MGERDKKMKIMKMYSVIMRFLKIILLNYSMVYTCFFHCMKCVLIELKVGKVILEKDR